MSRLDAKKIVILGLFAAVPISPSHTIDGDSRSRNEIRGTVGRGSGQVPVQFYRCTVENYYNTSVLRKGATVRRTPIHYTQIHTHKTLRVSHSMRDDRPFGLLRKSS
jgi:hypothetical protein